MVTAPRAEHRRHVRTHHGHEVDDPFAWLADPTDADVLAHLDAENDYAREMTAGLEPVRERIFEEIRARTQETDLSVPLGYRGWWYYSRTVAGRQYGIRARIPMVTPAAPGLDPQAVPTGEQILLDGDAEAEGSDFFAVGALEVSPDGALVAYSVDRRGDERFDVRVKDIVSGEILDEVVTGIGYGLVWSRDGRFLYYLRVDDAWRPHELWRHELGAPADSDVRLHVEPDERFWLSLGASRCERWLVLHAASRTTSEALLLDLDRPEGDPTLVAARQDGVEYEVEPCGDILLIVHNRDRTDFDIAWAPLAADPAGWATWQPWGRWSAAGELAGSAGAIADAVDVADAGAIVRADERVVGVDAFADQVVLSLRSRGLPALRVVSRRVGDGPVYGSVADIRLGDELAAITLGDNPTWEATRLRLRWESFLTPATVGEYDVPSGTVEVLRTTPVLRGYDPADYRQERAWAPASDGTLIPISLVRRADTPLDGTAPGLLYGYGAYEICLDPWFSIPRLSLLDRGLVYAVAHVRGGGEMGRAWYEGGRREHKPTTFTDTLACARYLADASCVDPARLALEGGSAGGLLVGAVLNLDPGRFAVALAQVPFVDALTSILDPELPLTVIEWDEWGDPLHDPQAYELIASYTPYENVAAARYPAILATTSLHDTRVSYSEPAKWVARLREQAVPDPDRPILLRIEMSAGHGGPSGRYHAWREYAWEMAFVLDRLGIRG